MEHVIPRGPARTAGALLALALAAGPLAAQTAGPADALALGRHLVQVAGCNDCHTAGYAMAAGRVDEKEWLTGDPLGWRASGLAKLSSSPSSSMIRPTPDA